MIDRLRKSIFKFVNSNKDYPIISLLIPALYPLLYYYDKNYALTNSWSQFLFLCVLYFLIPITLYFVLSLLLRHLFKKENLNNYLLTILNIASFLVFIIISVYGFQKKKLVLAIVISIILGFLLYKHLKKLLILQALMIVMVIPKLLPDIYRELVYSTEWMKQPDSIEKVKFKKHPNIYVIQPDGYVNFSTIENDLYNYDNSDFKSFLSAKGFTHYPEFRSNYFSTLSSNSSMMSMKHHYYGNSDFGINPSLNFRNVIVEDNPVHNIFKKNDYKTFLMLQVPYLLSNRPNINFDYCNFSLDEVPYMSRGFAQKKDLFEDTKNAILTNKSTRNFFFIESMKPSHIATLPNSDTNVEKERLAYLERIEDANKWLKKIITYITKEDPEGLIIIASDHGGYVGLNNTYESKTKVEDPLIIDSYFSAILAIKWPNDTVPTYLKDIKSSVNVFRVLFTYLSENDMLLEHLQDDSSYMVINNGAPEGVYEYIDRDSKLTFKKVDSKFD